MSRVPDDVAARLAALPTGTTRGRYEGRAWTLTIKRSGDGRRGWLWGEELGGRRRVSGNLYALRGGLVLKPCEMPAARVEAFLRGFAPDAQASPRPRFGGSGANSPG